MNYKRRGVIHWVNDSVKGLSRLPAVTRGQIVSPVLITTPNVQAMGCLRRKVGLGYLYVVCFLHKTNVNPRKKI